MKFYKFLIIYVLLCCGSILTVHTDLHHFSENLFKEGDKFMRNAESVGLYKNSKHLSALSSSFTKFVTHDVNNKGFVQLVEKQTTFPKCRNVWITSKIYEEATVLKFCEMFLTV